MTQALTHYLDDLLQGKPNLELRLLPLYRQLREARGITQTMESDLFFPDMDARPSLSANTSDLTDAARISIYKSSRAMFQRGLLAFLRQQDADQGLARMREAVQSIESAMTTTATRTFWWGVAAFVDSLITHSIEPNFTIKQLCGRIDLQLRRHIEGSNKIAERLLRDMLYFIAQSRDGSERITQVKQLFNLSELLPGISSESDDNLHRQLKSGLSALSQAKDAWNRFISGNTDSLATFQTHLKALQAMAPDLHQITVGELIDELYQVALDLPGVSDSRRDMVNLEITTTLLLLQNNLEHYEDIQDELHEQADTLRQRLHAAAYSDADLAKIGADISLLDTISRKAQERILVVQIAQEVQSNVRKIEEVLDEFFRDTQHDRNVLAGTEKPLKEIFGALRIMQWDQASQAFERAKALIEQCAEPETAIDESQFPLIAEIISAISLYVDAERYQQANAPAILYPVLVQLGLVEQAGDGAHNNERIEDDITRLKSDLSQQVGAWQQGDTSDSAKKKLIVTLEELGQDAGLIGDQTLKSQAESALRQLNDENPTQPIDTLLDVISGKSSPVADPLASPPTQLSNETIDAELLEIFLTEAEEVLAAITQSLDALAQSDNKLEALREIRRGYHTLKGSGRMVKLHELGETAWAVEQLLNLWLQQSRSVNDELLALLYDSRTLLSGWIDALSSKHAFTADYQQLITRADHLRAWADEDEATNLSERFGEAAAVGQTTEAISEVQPLSTPDTAQHTESEQTSLDLAAATTPELEPAETHTEVSDFATVQPELSNETGHPEITSNREAPEDTERNITIGDTVVPAVLLDIFLREADSHLHSLREQLETSIANPTQPVSHEFMRAAHTLAGISRLTGFAAVAELSHALEIWLTALHTSQQALPESGHTLTHQSIEQLGLMLHAIENHLAPDFSPDLIETLHQARALPTSTDNDSEEPAFAESNTDGHATEIELVTETVATEALEAALAAETVEADMPLLESAFTEHPMLETPDLDVSELEVSVAETPMLEGPTLEAPAVEVPMHEAPSHEAPSVETPTFETPMAGPQATELTMLTPSVTEMPGTIAGQISDDVDEQLLNIFLEEANDLMPAIEQTLRDWRQEPTGAAQANIQRLLHTLKGSARMAGAMRLGALTHELETVVGQHIEAQNIQPEDFNAFESHLDQINLVLEQLRHPETQTGATQVPAVAQAAGQGATHATFVVPESELAGQALRVRADTVDRLVNEAGEISITRSRLQSSAAVLRSSTQELTENAERLRGQLRELDLQAELQMQSSLSHMRNEDAQFDPLEFDRFTRLQELTRMIAESVNDIQTEQQNLLLGLNETDAALTQQGRLSKSLQQTLMHIRMVPLSSIADRLHRTVRLAAKALDKKASLQLSGAQVEFDRGMLAKLVAPLEHLLRNAIAHGIEFPSERLHANKSEYGEILLSAKQASNEIIISLHDDGRGLNLEAIRKRAIQNGLIEADAQLSDESLSQLIFASGFSTAESVTTLSGRGVGMDVVKNEITLLGGRIDMQSVPGKGLNMTLFLPLTLAVTQAVLVQIDERRFAIPSAMIEQVQQFKPDQLEKNLKSGSITWLGQAYPFYYLPRLFGEMEHYPQQQAYSPVLLLRSGNARAAILVDDMTGNQEIVVKNIGSQLASVPGIAGATVLGNGQIVLILNPVQLALQQVASAQQHPVQTVHAASSEPGRHTVMVVDDSLTVRKITTRLLQREGYEVITAKDGIDALQLLQHHKPDVMLLDIEMPRMDGFELTKVMRSDSEMAHIPIIMITSRTADKHREHAFSLGVNAYLGKPYQEDILIAKIMELAHMTVNA